MDRTVCPIWPVSNVQARDNEVDWNGMRTAQVGKRVVWDSGAQEAGRDARKHPQDEGEREAWVEFGRSIDDGAARRTSVVSEPALPMQAP